MLPSNNTAAAQASTTLIAAGTWYSISSTAAVVLFALTIQLEAAPTVHSTPSAEASEHSTPVPELS